MAVSDKPRLLDLFCGAGGAAMGYHHAGFDVVGVDINPQPHYPFEFHQADALTFPLDGYDVIHASPPCQRYSKSTKRWGDNDHPDLIAVTRERIEHLSYVIENVPGAPLVDPIMLCGSMFDLRVDARYLQRHRLFESNVPLKTPDGRCDHSGYAVGVYGHPGGRSTRDGLTFGTTDLWRIVMDTPWMTGKEMAQAIPPAYTEWIGRQLIQVIE